MTNYVITGSASGIGAQAAKIAQNRGEEIIGVDLHDTTIQVDLSTEQGRQSAVKEILVQTNSKIDKLVLGAGLGGHVEDGSKVAQVNYFGAVQLLDGLKDALAAAKGRCVVIGSNSAQMRIDPQHEIINALLANDEEKAMQVIGDMHGALVYGMSKHALSRAVRRRAAEFGQAGITLNAIAPGMTRTPLFEGTENHPQLKEAVNAIPIPKNRLASAGEIAGMIDFMLSPAADYMQGSVIYMDGGTDAQFRPDAF